MSESPSVPLGAFRAAAFTRIEVLTVIVILGLLAAAVIPRVMDQSDQDRITRARQDVSSLVTALNIYRLDNLAYPSTDQGLEALVRAPAGLPAAPNWNSGGYIDRPPVDPWGNPYQYQNPGLRGEIDVYSLGADGAAGGEGLNEDIGNWNG